MRNLHIVRDTTTHHLPPWKKLDMLTVDAVPFERPKDEYTPEELKAISLEKIRSFKMDFTIYTDGSTSGSQLDGGAGVLVLDYNNNGNTTLEVSYPAGSFC